MTDETPTILSFYLIFKNDFEKYNSFFGLYNHYYEIFKSMESKDVTEITKKIQLYVKTGIEENIFPKFEIFKMIELDSFFFSQLFQEDEKLKNNDLINFIYGILEYIDRQDMDNKIKINSELMMELNELKGRISYLEHITEKIDYLDSSVSCLMSKGINK